MEVEEISIGDVRPSPHNSRLHSDDQVRDIAASIREFGWTVPLLIDETGTLLAGHGRLRAAQLLQQATVKCIRKVGLTDHQKRAYVIADNKLAQGSEWDEKLLSMELRELLAADFNVGVIGFDDAELNLLLRDAATPEDRGSVAWSDADSVPEAPAEEAVVTQPGDVWLMGRHRLMCGDSCNPVDMQRLCIEKVDLWLTDPPYNVNYEGGGSKRLKIKNDHMPDKAFRKFLAAAYGSASEVMKPGAAFYVWHADSEGYNFRGAAQDVGWPVRQCLIWRKNSLVLGRQDYHWQHEPCLYGWKPGAAHKWFGGRKLTTLQDVGSPPPFAQQEDGRWAVQFGNRVLLIDADAAAEELAPGVLHEAKPARNAAHPTMKPVALFEQQMMNSTALGDTVLDSFGGSGTTVIAAQRSGRIARLMELDPRYCDVIIRRWQDFVGAEATLEATGETFGAVDARRHAVEAAA